MKCNEVATRTMSHDFIIDQSDLHDNSMVKLNGFLVTALMSQRSPFRQLRKMKRIQEDLSSITQNPKAYLS